MSLGLVLTLSCGNWASAVGEGGLADGTSLPAVVTAAEFLANGHSPEAPAGKAAVFDFFRSPVAGEDGGLL